MNIFKIDKKKIIREDQFSICYGCVNNKDLQIRVLKKQNINRGLIDKLLVMQNIYLSKIYAILEENEENIIIVEDRYEDNLYEEFKRRKKDKIWFTEQEIIQIMTQIVKAYQYLYDNQIMHGDLNSMNIFLTGHQVKLGYISLHNLDGASIICSPAFSAPEIFQTKAYSCLSEVFSLGVIYYKLVTKTMPFKGKTQLEITKLLYRLKVEPLKCSPIVCFQAAQTIENMLTYSIENRMSWQELFQNPLFNTKQPSIIILKTNQRTKLEDSIFFQKGKYIPFNEQLFIDKGVDHSKLSRFQHILNIYLAKVQYIQYVQIQLLSNENLLNVAKQAVANYCVCALLLDLLNQCQGICLCQMEYLNQEFLKFDQDNLLRSLKEFSLQQSQEDKSNIFKLYKDAEEQFNKSKENLLDIMPEENNFGLIHKQNPQFEDYIKYLELAKTKLVNPNNDKLGKMYDKMLQLHLQYPLRLYSSVDPKNILSIPN